MANDKSMKKFLGILVLMVLLNGCDDGDLKVEAINFDDVAADDCGEVIYKIKGNEALFIKIPATWEPFKNEITAPNTPDVIPIGGDVVVRYRSYNGEVTANNLCPNVIQPIFPAATVEWIASAGSIEITTTAVMSAPDPVTGATKLVKYNHNIVFKLLKFTKPEGEQFYNEFVFGDYLTDATALSLDFPAANARLCPSRSTIYNAKNPAIEAMFIQNIDPSLLSTDNLNVPKRGLISSTINKLSYRLLTTALPLNSNESYFCSSPLPTTPAVNEEWLAEDGIANTSGIIEVTTTTNGPSSFLHTVRLRGVTFRKGTATFYYGNDILFGEITD